jgi:hypothetical protein
MTTANTTKTEIEIVTETFLAMVKIEMMLSGKSFDECKVLVKDYLREKGLL